MVALSEQFARELLDVVDAGDGNHGVAAQRRGDDYWLGLAVGDDAYAHIRRGELGQFALELVTEVSVLERVDRPHEFAFGDESHTGAFGTQMRVVVGTVEDFVHALVSRYAAQKT